jgi:hypothetical protein
MWAIEQDMIEARQTSVAPPKATGIAGAKGDAAEGYRFSRAGIPGPTEKIRRTVAVLSRKRAKLCGPVYAERCLTLANPFGHEQLSHCS